MASFTTTLNPTPFGVYDSDDHFQEEADGMVTWVKRRLGDDIMSVELTNKQIWACFEESVLEFSKHVNGYQAESYMSNLLGMPTGSLVDASGNKTGPNGFEQSFPRDTLEYLLRRAEPYAGEAGIGGSYNAISGSIQLKQNQQDYNIYEELEISVNGENIKMGNTDRFFGALTGSNPGEGLLPHAVKTKLRIYDIFHFSPQAAYRFFDTTSAVNYLNNQFAFESFTPETVFYVLPVYEDLLRAGQLDISNRVRRSNYSYLLQGTNLRIYPRPTQDKPQRLFIKFGFPADPFKPSFKFDDDSLKGVNNISNIPFGNIPFKTINSMSRAWIRKYTLALSKETLGFVRSKFSSVPIPGADLSMNGSELVSQGREDQSNLITGLKETLDKLTYQKLLEGDAAEGESMMQILKRIPIPNGKCISMG